MKLTRLLIVILSIGAMAAGPPTSQSTTTPAKAPAKAKKVAHKAKKPSIASSLQAVSVTLSTGMGEGSGVVVKRGPTNFVLTAGHVVTSLRKTREVVDTRTGTKRTIVEFDDVKVIQTLYEDGRKVGQLEMLAVVVCYSGADHGEDLAVLKILKRDFVNASAKFFLEEEPPDVGLELYHVGSLQGQLGSNSLTTGIISQIGRRYQGKLYDQTSCTAFPGSSGGGVFTKAEGEYVGMLVRGAGETFNLIVPIRRIKKWMDKMNLTFILDPSIKIPTEDELNKVPIEDSGKTWPVPRTASGDKKPAEAGPGTPARAGHDDPIFILPKRRGQPDHIDYWPTGPQKKAPVLNPY